MQKFGNHIVVINFLGTSDLSNFINMKIKERQCHITKQLVHSFSINIRISQPLKVMFTSASPRWTSLFSGWQILMLISKGCINCIMCTEINTDQNWVLSTLVIGKGRQDTSFCKVDTKSRLFPSKKFQLAQIFL